MQSGKNRYKNPFGYKLIYVFRINDDAHKNCLKVGDTTVVHEGSPAELYAKYGLTQEEINFIESMIKPME